MQTKQLSDFVLSIRYEDLDSRTLDMVRKCVLDLMGVALAGSVQEQASIWDRYFFSHTPPSGEASVWRGDLRRAGCRQAAGFNAACGHMLDMDDVHGSSISHLGVVTIPAALSVGQTLHRSGKALCAAIVAGYEAGARIGEAITPESYRYWHTTGIVGTFSSAAAAGKLLGLDRRQMLHCFGSAGTQSSGLWQFLEDGAMSKSLHTANATICGIRSAELAQAGFTGASQILEGRKGLVRALAPQGDLDALTRGLGVQPYRILSNSFKPYACCRHTHSAVYCVEKLLQRHRIDPGEVESIVDRTYQLAKDVADKPHPAVPYAYKFSLQYCIAAFLVYHELGQSAFTGPKTGDPRVRRLMDRVLVTVDRELEQAYQRDRGRWPHLLEITLRDGRVLRERVDHPLGDFKNPLSWDDAVQKFYRLTQSAVPPERAKLLVERIGSLERLEDSNDLFPGGRGGKLGGERHE